MVTIRTATAPSQGAAGQEQSLARLLQQGRVLAVISGEALEELALGGHERIVAGYAEHVGYPLPDREQLHTMVKYQSLTTGWPDRQLKQDYLDVTASHIYELAGRQGVNDDTREEAAAESSGLSVSQFAARLGYPRLDQGAADPLLILANLRLPIYLTTSPLTFVEEALRRAGAKEVKTDFLRWRPELDGLPSVLAARGKGDDYRPSQAEPLVYHLFGLDTYPESLVLTEDDYLDYLMASAQGRGKDRGVDPVDDVVKAALQTSALLLLGFSLSSWAFRTLYRVLIRPMPEKKLYERCCVQLAPSEQEKLYLESYLRQEAHFDQVFWEPIDVFCRSRLRP